MLSSRPLTLAVLGFALSLGGCDRQSAPPRQGEASEAAAAAAETGALDRSHKGSELPDFTVKDAAGKEQPLAALKGKPLLINLWATWCAPCIAELPQLDRLAAAGKISVLTVSQDSRHMEKIAPFLAAKGGSHLGPWLDPDGDLGAQYQIQNLPTSILYDAQGREVWRVSGPLDWNGAAAAKALAEAGA